MKNTQIISEQINYIFYKCEVNDRRLAKLFFGLFPEKFMYENSQKIWYSLNDYGIWEIEKECYTCLNMLSEDLYKYINNYVSNKAPLLRGYALEKLYSNAVKISKMLGTNKKKDDILKELKQLYIQKDLLSRMDKVNPYIIPFNNGVYDLENKIFRNAKPEELVSITVGYDFKIPSNKYIKKSNNILESIFWSDESKRYVLQQLANSLVGHNDPEKVLFFIGNGANGKGVLITIMRAFLGNLWGNLESDYFFESKHGVHANRPMPGIVDNKNSRGVCVNEPPEIRKMHIDLLKKLSGGDELSVRTLYGQNFEMVAKFILVFLMNNEPMLNITGDANEAESLVRRLVMIEFLNTFKSKPDPNNLFHKEKKLDLKSEIIRNKKFKMAFMYIFINFYYDSLKNPQDQPLEISKRTQKYLNKNSPISSFISEMCVTTKNQNDYISGKALFEAFKEFNDCDNVIIFKNFIEKIKNKGITYKRKTNEPHKGLYCFFGIKLLNDIKDDNDIGNNSYFRKQKWSILDKPYVKLKDFCKKNNKIECDEKPTNETDLICCDTRKDKIKNKIEESSQKYNSLMSKLEKIKTYFIKYKDAHIVKITGKHDDVIKNIKSFIKNEKNNITKKINIIESYKKNQILPYIFLDKDTKEKAERMKFVNVEGFYKLIYGNDYKVEQGYYEIIYGSCDNEIIYNYGNGLYSSWYKPMSYHLEQLEKIEKNKKPKYEMIINNEVDKNMFDSDDEGEDLFNTEDYNKYIKEEEEEYNSDSHKDEIDINLIDFLPYEDEEIKLTEVKNQNKKDVLFNPNVEIDNDDILNMFN